MLLEKMYVRCPIDHDMINPRDFLMGQIAKIDVTLIDKIKSCMS